jgi:hypothetical protein
MTEVIVLSELLELLHFYACLLMAAAISGLVLAFVPRPTLSIMLSIVALASGIAGRVWWERASK